MRSKARLLEIVEDVRGSYWFVPVSIALVGFCAGLLLVYLDALIGDKWLGRFEWFYGSRPEGARSLLSTVAGSTITVAGVVFSITLAAVTYASGQYGPRLLSNFVRDRGESSHPRHLHRHIPLLPCGACGRSAAQRGNKRRHWRRASRGLRPHLAMFGALALAITSIGVLIYFVHHVTTASTSTTS